MIDLNSPGSYLEWGWLQISWANAIVILLMVVAFVLALVVPFPGHGALLPASRPHGTDADPSPAQDPR